MTYIHKKKYGKKIAFDIVELPEEVYMTKLIKNKAGVLCHYSVAFCALAIDKVITKMCSAEML